MTPIPLVGIGLRHCHYEQFISTKPDIDWVEVHSENFFSAGDNLLSLLYKVRQDYPISLHGIGLSLGSAEGVRIEHLTKLRDLINIIDPILVSEHLSWSISGSVYLPDLLPLPYTKESLQVLTDNVSRTQDFLKRKILIENPSSYLEYSESEFEEADFLVTLAVRTGAKILLDVNNVFVSCSNHNEDAAKYIRSIPTSMIGEVHLAGHQLKQITEDTFIRIDTHDNCVCEEVWDLYESLTASFIPPYVLLEWDADLPELETLVSEAKKVLKYTKPKVVR